MQAFAIPISRKEATFTQYEIKSPTAGTLASSHKVAQTGDHFTAMLVFLAGVVERVATADGDEITDGDYTRLKSVLAHTPYRAAEDVVIKALCRVHDDTGIEGVYPCPRCGHKHISELAVSNDEEEEGLDTRDYVEQLPVKMLEDMGELQFTLELNEPVTLINTANKQVLEEIRSMTFVHPTLNHCISAYKKYGNRDAVRLQFATYVEAMTHKNGEEVDNKWRNNFGMMVFENLKNIKDLRELSTYVSQYGLDNRVKKTCTECGKEWMASVSTHNFFASALQTTA